MIVEVIALDYMSLFPSATRNLSRFSSLAEAILSQVNDLLVVIAALPEAYSVSGSVGAQMDAIGESFMLPRPEGMSDTDYRMYLMGKLKLFTWDGSNDSIPGILSDIDPAARISDNGDGTITVSNAPSQIVDEGLYPVPAGVRTIVS